jgi:hypothetical protein
LEVCDETNQAHVLNFMRVLRARRMGQSVTCNFPSAWGEFHWHNMQRWNACENVINVQNVGSLLEGIGSPVAHITSGFVRRQSGDFDLRQ